METPSQAAMTANLNRCVQPPHAKPTQCVGRKEREETSVIFSIQGRSMVKEGKTSDNTVTVVSPKNQKRSHMSTLAHIQSF